MGSNLCDQLASLVRPKTWLACAEFAPLYRAAPQVGQRTAFIFLSLGLFRFMG
jgi:hypothetical protein